MTIKRLAVVGAELGHKGEREREERGFLGRQPCPLLPICLVPKTAGRGFQVGNLQPGSFVIRPNHELHHPNLDF